MLHLCSTPEFQRVWEIDAQKPLLKQLNDRHPAASIHNESKYHIHLNIYLHMLLLPLSFTLKPTITVYFRELGRDFNGVKMHELQTEIGQTSSEPKCFGKNEIT